MGERFSAGSAMAISRRYNRHLNRPLPGLPMSVFRYKAPTVLIAALMLMVRWRDCPEEYRDGCALGNEWQLDVASGLEGYSPKGALSCMKCSMRNYEETNQDIDWIRQ
jgi:hypothetical protein